MRYILFFSFFGFLLSSCDTNRYFEENRQINNATWNEKDRVVFEVTVEDTLNAYDFYINLRQSGSYNYSNIFFFIDTWFPNGKTARDTVECMLADDKGNWLGKGLGDIKDNRILFKKGVRFPLKGKYAFVFQQAMREPELTGVYDIGMRIEKNSN